MTELEHAGLAQLAYTGAWSWATLALHERAAWGIVLYTTWIHLSSKERSEIATMSRTGARLTIQKRKLSYVQAS